MSNSADWLLPVYHTVFSAAVQIGAHPQIPSVDAVATSAPPARHSSLTPSDHGRISKPVRRRSRASRRTPTTLLNTDASNFRAMVQQFTGGPAARFVAGPPYLPSAAGAMLGFAPAAPSEPPVNGFHAQFPNQQEVAVFGTEDGGDEEARVVDRSNYGGYMMMLRP